MKTATILAILAATAASSPINVKRGTYTENELTDGTACRKITFIYARGSTEIGNMGETVGPPTCRGLKSAYGETEVACQGVGRPYTAGLIENAEPGGTTVASYEEAETLYTEAHTKCPSTIILGGGYSQGAAVTTDAIQRLSTDVQNQIAGVVLYGDTRNKQDDGSIPNFPKDKVKVYCKASDGVCGGLLIVTAAHLTYATDVSSALDYLKGQISSYSASSSSASSTSSADSSTSSTASLSSIF